MCWLYNFTISRVSILSSNMRSGASCGFSSLCCDVLEKILDCMPLQDTIRTSVLSRWWTYKWLAHSELLIDDIVDKGLLLKTIIYEVKFFHQGALHKFSLLVPNSKLFSDVDSWILSWSNKKVQELSLGFLKSFDFRLPSHLFKFQWSKVPEAF